MNAHQVIASLFALARNSGRASKEYPEGTADHEVTETAAVACAKLGLELEHAHHLAAPAHAELCPLCRGARVLSFDDRDAERCYFCEGAGFLRVLVGALALACLVLVGCGGAEFTSADPFARAVDGSGFEPVADGAVLEPGPDASAEAAAEDLGEPVRDSGFTGSDAEDLGKPVRDSGSGDIDAEDLGDAAREASPPPPPICTVTDCPACPSLSYACCVSAAQCGCESPAQGGQCR